MPENKIVTKKTAARPGTAANRTGPAAAPAKATPTKKTAARAAGPTPTRASAAPASGAPTKKTRATSKPPATRPDAGPTQPAAVAPLEEKPVSLQNLARVTGDQRLTMIREAAYYKAEKRNFAVGHEEHDWAEAEREIDELLAKAKQIYGA